MDKCWKCGKELTSENRSEIVYTSNPPKYTCKSCDPESFLGFFKSLAEPIEAPQPKEVWFFYYNVERPGFDGWDVVTTRSKYYSTFKEAWEAKEAKAKDIKNNSTCESILGPVLKGYIVKEQSTPTGDKEKADIWVVGYNLREKGGYAYETEEYSVLFASEKEADQFYADLPKYVEKKFVYYTLESRSMPKRLGAICKYDRDNLNVTVM